MESISKPQLLLFTSIDVVGATQFKQKEREKVSNKNQTYHAVLPWVETFLEFYKDFPNIIQRKYEKNNSIVPQIWKLLGDEIILFAPMKEYSDLPTSQAWDQIKDKWVCPKCGEHHPDID